MGELPQELHEYVSSACAHRQHQDCNDADGWICPYCLAMCACVCHRWHFEPGLPVETP